MGLRSEIRMKTMDWRSAIYRNLCGTIDKNRIMYEDFAALR